MNHCRSIRAGWVGIALLALAGAAGAHDGAHESAPPASRVLGEIEFPVTTDSAPARQSFIEGMLLLHLFEYPYAAERFRHAQALDPGFAMAYWGEAMTHHHPIWDRQDRDAARAVMTRLGATPEARLAKASSATERDWIAGLDVLFGDGPRDSRNQAWMRHLREMAQRYPDDHEVQLFYALSLMGTTAGVRHIPTYMEAAARAQRVFYANRRHPGAAHYFIHGVDDPVHAPLGLEAARALFEMAPDAGHSLHMTSHIFIALGLWDDMVEANRRAARVADAMRAERGEPGRHWGHYNYWLLYGLLQQGRDDQAAELLRAAWREMNAREIPPADPLELDPDHHQVASVVQMWARYMLETRGGNKEIAAWNFEVGQAFDPRLNLHYVRGMLAKSVDDVTRHRKAFDVLRGALRAAIARLDRQAPADLLYLDRLDVIALELEAAEARARGNLEQAIEHAREASRLEGEMPFSFGPPFVDLPSDEYLGELLLAAGRNAEAAEAFARQLERSRGKPRARQGLSEATAR